LVFLTSDLGLVSKILFQINLYLYCSSIVWECYKVFSRSTTLYVLPDLNICWSNIYSIYVGPTFKLKDFIYNLSRTSIYVGLTFTLCFPILCFCYEWLHFFFWFTMLSMRIELRTSWILSNHLTTRLNLVTWMTIYLSWRILLFFLLIFFYIKNLLFFRPLLYEFLISNIITDWILKIVIG
jgi:hypothetical protein